MRVKLNELSRNGKKQQKQKAINCAVKFEDEKRKK